MTKFITKKLNDSSVARWTALVLIALMMFFAYMFVDVLSPLKELLQTERGWDSVVFGIYGSSEFFLNVFVFFLIFAGIILDKMGVRFTGLLSASLMVIGAGIKLYGISDYFVGGGVGYEFFSSFMTGIPASAKVACIGFAIFGCGAEMAGITVSRAIVKWFTGKELAMAMGLEMAVARLGVFAVLQLSPYVSKMSLFGITATPSVVTPVAVCTLLLLIGLICFFVFSIMDRKLDKQTDTFDVEQSPDEKFKVSDLGILFTSKNFMIVAILCVLYYSAIFPFQRFGTDMLHNSLGISVEDASSMLSLFPIGAMILTPFLGAFIDYKGKGATMLIVGSVLMITCHLIFAIVPLTKPIAYTAIVILGISFSLVPAALWPSVPRLVKERYLGSSYSVIFWIQNIGLLATPILIGWALKATNRPVEEMLTAGIKDVPAYDYTVPMLIFASFGVLAFILSVILKAWDKKYKYGLELPNVKKKEQ